MEPAPELPVTSSPAPIIKHKSRWVLSIAALLVVLLLIGGAVYLASNPLVALRGVHVLAIDTQNSTLKVFGFTKLKDTSFRAAEGTIIGYAHARAARTSAAIMRNAEGGQSVLIDPGTEPYDSTEVRAEYSSESDLSGLAISDDGHTFAFAERNPLATGPAAQSLSAWTVHILDSSGREIVSVPGYAPHFFLDKGKTYLMATAPGGVVVVDVAAGTSVVEALVDSDSIARTVSISPDGAFIAMPDASVRTYSLYGVTSLAPLRMSMLWKLDAEVSSVAWYQGVLYGVSNTGEESSLIAFRTFGKAASTPVYTFPEPSVLYRITP